MSGGFAEMITAAHPILAALGRDLKGGVQVEVSGRQTQLHGPKAFPVVAEEGLEPPTRGL